MPAAPKKERSAGREKTPLTLAFSSPRGMHFMNGESGGGGGCRVRLKGHHDY